MKNSSYRKSIINFYLTWFQLRRTRVNGVYALTTLTSTDNVQKICICFDISTNLSIIRRATNYYPSWTNSTHTTKSNIGLDRVKTTFMTKQANYQNNVMTFKLKTAGATYQKMINKIFREKIEENLEVCMDNMIVKSCVDNLHTQHIHLMF